MSFKIENMEKFIFLFQILISLILFSCGGKGGADRGEEGIIIVNGKFEGVFKVVSLKMLPEYMGVEIDKGFLFFKKDGSYKNCNIEKDLQGQEILQEEGAIYNVEDNKILKIRWPDHDHDDIYEIKILTKRQIQVLYEYEKPEPNGQTGQLAIMERLDAGNFPLDDYFHKICSELLKTPTQDGSK
jgi:hypothetical protein